MNPRSADAVLNDDNARTAVPASLCIRGVDFAVLMINAGSVPGRKTQAYPPTFSMDTICRKGGVSVSFVRGVAMTGLGDLTNAIEDDEVRKSL